MKKSLLVGAIIGGAAAGLTAIFVAPKKGSELRSDAQVKFSELKTKTQETIANLKEKRSKEQAQQEAQNEIVQAEEVVAVTQEETENEEKPANE